MKRSILILPLLILALVLAACDSPTGPSTVTILTNARVIGGTGSIAAEDTSRTIPEDQAAIVEFVVRDPGGRTADAASVTPKGEVTFTGLEPGVYTVEQTVYLKDNTIGPVKVHNNVVVD